MEALSDEIDIFESIPWTSWCRLCAKKDFRKRHKLKNVSHQQMTHEEESIEDISENKLLCDAIEKYYNVKV